MKSILFLVSGGGGNLKFFHQAVEHEKIKTVKLGVIADRECGGLSYARDNDFYGKLVAYDRKNSKELICAIEAFSPDVIVTNWHKILGSDVVDKYRGRLVNLHYSLLPAFSGLIGIKPIELAYQQGCKYMGPTCHRVNEEVDSGYILSQHVFKTPAVVDAAVSMMFRTGCLVLLSGVEQVLGESLQDGGEITPYIDWRIEKFSASFWNKLASL